MISKNLKHVNQGKTQCWVICVISKWDSLMKIAIKPELVCSCFSLKIFSATIDQCTLCYIGFTQKKSICLSIINGFSQGQKRSHRNQI